MQMVAGLLQGEIKAWGCKVRNGGWTPGGEGGRMDRAPRPATLLCAPCGCGEGRHRTAPGRRQLASTAAHTAYATAGRKDERQEGGAVHMPRLQQHLVEGRVRCSQLHLLGCTARALCSPQIALVPPLRITVPTLSIQAAPFAAGARAGAAARPSSGRRGRAPAACVHGVPAGRPAMGDGMCNAPEGVNPKSACGSGRSCAGASSAHSCAGASSADSCAGACNSAAIAVSHPNTQRCLQQVLPMRCAAHTCWRAHVVLLITHGTAHT